MPRTTVKELLDAGVHFGHLKRKWNPAMAPYIFMERNGIHIIDLEKTLVKLEEASAALKQIAKSGRKILFVATKKQAKELVSEKVKAINMPYVTERWPGGMLTNFPTIRKAVKKMSSIDKMATDGTLETMSKRERLQVARQRAKLEKNLGSIADLTRLPAALFVVDVMKEYIAVREANRLNIPVFAMVDTNSDPTNIDYPIPANDDASKSIALIVDIVCKAIEEGLEERKLEREKDKETVARGQKAPGKPKSGKDDMEEEEQEDTEEKSPVKPARKRVVKTVVEEDEEEELGVEDDDDDDDTEDMNEPEDDDQEEGKVTDHHEEEEEENKNNKR
ncbi:MAG TPA: 30S ribosomal protein S2 [Bacteroidetes bacterium]|nr:30S ribosomal protein S2 [Bacteroidota bacterium]